MSAYQKNEKKNAVIVRLPVNCRPVTVDFTYYHIILKYKWSAVKKIEKVGSNENT